MKAFVITHCGPDGLEPATVPTPDIGPGDVLVDVRAASINPLDKMIRNGEFKQLILKPGGLAISVVGPPRSQLAVAAMVAMLTPGSARMAARWT